MATQLLLKEDVDGLGLSGEIVKVKPGYARNYLLPQGLAVIANKQALRMQERLREQRRAKAVVDKQEAEGIAARIGGVTLVSVVKVDHDGHMYGSVTIADLLHQLRDEYQVEVEKKSIQLKHPIKTLGIHTIPVRLKEEITTSFQLKVESEEEHRAAKEAPAAKE